MLLLRQPLFRIALFLSLFLFSTKSYATHISGGDLDVQWVSGNDYRITLKLFRDCANGGAGFDNSVTITVRDNAAHNIITSFTMSFKESRNLTLGDACFSPPSSVCMQEGVYTRVVTLANNPNGLYFAWERCCRSPLNLNLVRDQSMVFYAQMPDPALRNSSPKFGSYPVNGYMCINEKNYFNFDVSDPDGDELRFSLITPLRGSATGTGNPVSTTAGPKPYREILWQSPYNLSNIVGGTPNMSIDPVTGIVSCSPVTQGAFTFAILVEEYRNGVKIGEIIRDIQFFALNCNKQVASINQTPIDDDTALEGCIKASFKFELSKSLSKDTTICYEIQGTATNGVDYAFLDDCITIPAGQTYGTIIIDAYNEGITEGREDIYLIYNPIPCVDFVKDTVFLFIDDAEPIDFELDGINLTCNGGFSGQIDATITGGYPPYVITVTDDSGNGTSTNYTSADLPITGLPAGTYLVEIDDIYGCGGAAQPVAAVYDTGATFLPDGNGNVYTTTLTVSGISNPTMTDPDEIQQVCLNMEHSFLGDLEMKLIAPDGTELILKERFNAADGNSCDLGEPIARAPKDGAGSTNTDPGTGWDYCFTPTPNFGTMVDESGNYTRTYTDPLGRTYNDNYLPSGAYTPYEPFSDLIGVPLNGDWTIWVKDHLPQDNGWIFSWSIVFKSGGRPGDIITLTEPDPIDITLNGTITKPSCGGTNGAINIDVSGDFPAFTYLWSNGATTQDISGLSAGTYTVTVTDNNSCSNDATFDVSNTTGPGISAVVLNEQCIGQNNGSIDATFTTSGSITSISWSNGATTEDISGLSPGDYTVEVTDNSGCKTMQTFTISAATDISISGAVTNEKCGDQEGEINLTVTGGAGAYTFVWSNGGTSEDVTDLNQNTYIVTVTDANGCSKQKSFSVINEVGQCTVNCDVTIVSSNIVDENCGDGLGSVSISVSTSNPPYYVNWSNGMTGDVISGLSAGSYTATVTDAENCQFTQTFTVENNSGTLAITSPIVTDETCGSANGAIDVTVSGGSGSYTYSWSNGASSQDISGLSAGDYTLTVTDGASCSTSATLTVLNDAGNMAINLVSLTNEVCDNVNGSINIDVTPSATYSYAWSNGATTQDVSGLSAGTYSVVVTNTSTACALTSQDFVVSNSSGTLSVVVTDTDNEVCGSSNGEIDLTISGGTPTYDILWNTGTTTQDLVDIPAGTYSATITDQNGCVAQTGDIVILNISGTLSATAIATNEVCGNGQGAINLIVNGGTPSYTYSWSTGATTEDISNLSSGVYTYTVEDQNGCVFSNSVSVGDDAGTLSINNINVTHATCGSNNGAIDITVSGGDGTYIYVWSNGASSQDLTNITNGSYTITVSDGSGCSTNTNITVNGTLALDNVTITNDLCGTAVGAIDITISGGSTYTYSWSNGATTQDISGLVVGSYTVVVTSFEGCTYTNTFNVSNDPACNEMCSTFFSNAVSGSIYDSGGASANYKNDENCGFLIEPYCATSVTLSFAEFRMENNADFLMVYDGVDNSGTLLLRATGTSTPATVTANSGAMFIQYLSDISRNDRGFRANWTSVQTLNMPVAGFTASATTVYTGQNVNFTNTTTDGDIYSWDMDNDGIEDYDVENPSHSFPAAGVYTVTLTVTNCNGTDTYSVDITVEGRPIISTTPISGTSASISSCTQTADVTITIVNSGDEDLVWSISNPDFTPSPSSGVTIPSSSTTVTVSIPAYEFVGTYTEIFTITSNDPITPTKTITITINQSVECFGLFCSSTGTSQSTGQITDSGGEAGNYRNDENCTYLIQPDCVGEITLSFSSFEFSVGDTLFVYDGTDNSGTLLLKVSGNTLPSNLVAGSKAMFLQVVTDDSGTAPGFVAIWTSTISPDAPSANFETSVAEPIANESFSFNNTTSGVSITWLWDFGDGNTSTDQNPQHTYTEIGCYDVTLYVSSGEGCENITLKEVCVIEKSVTDPDPEPEEPQPLPFRIFPNPTSGIVGIDLAGKEFELIVFNVLGERVNYGLNKLNDYQYVVDISQLSRATYIFKLNGQVYKIVKMD